MKKFFLAMMMIASILPAMAQNNGVMLSSKPVEQKLDLVKEHFMAGGNVTVDMYCIMHGSVLFAVSREGRTSWIYVDPVRKNGKQTFDYANMPKADAILLTHDHFDHFDVDVINELSKEGTIVVGPECCAAASQIKVVAAGKQLRLPCGMTVKACYAYNTSKEHQQFHPKGVGLGYVLTQNNFVAYVAGDTEPIPEMKSLSDKRVTLALLPVNQPYTMTPSQCVEAAKMIAPAVLVPYHMGDTPWAELQAMAGQLPGIEVRLHQELK